MWNFEEVGADASAEAEAEVQARNQRQKKVGFHVRRIPSQIKLVQEGLGGSSTIIPARVFSNDFRANSARIFVPVRFFDGQKVSLTIGDSSRYFVNGSITWCKAFLWDTKVHCDVWFRYRIEMQFHFSSEEQKQETQRYARSFYDKYMIQEIVDE